jgi:hypothetical protein
MTISDNMIFEGTIGRPIGYNVKTSDDNFLLCGSESKVIAGHERCSGEDINIKDFYNKSLVGIRVLPSRDNDRRVSPTIERGVRPSACNASCELLDIGHPL